MTIDTNHLQDEVLVCLEKLINVQRKTPLVFKAVARGIQSILVRVKTGVS